MILQREIHTTQKVGKKRFNIYSEALWGLNDAEILPNIQLLYWTLYVLIFTVKLYCNQIIGQSYSTLVNL